MKPTTNIGLKRHQGAQVLAAINEFLKSSESDIIDWNQIKDVFSVHQIYYNFNENLLIS